jgi:hypothetical protein
MSSATITPQSPGGFTGILASIGQALIPSDLQQQATQVETEIELALSVMIGLEFIIVIELLVLTAIAWKER